MQISILIPQENESWSAFVARAKKETGEVLIIPSRLEELLIHDAKECTMFFDTCKAISERLMIATKMSSLKAEARSRGIRVIDTEEDLRSLVGKHPLVGEAVRLFSPHIWRQKLRSHLQEMGLLSLPKLRIWVLSGVSGFLFLFVLFRLLPSATIQVWPRGDTISQTVNIFLVLSGSTVEIPDRVRKIPLVPVTVNVTKVITFDQISKEFTGTAARAPMTIVNNSEEPYSLRAGTRLVNQAGMIFRLDEPVEVPPSGEVTVRSTADDLDLYGEMIGERGNVPEGLKWDFPGLSDEERSLVYAENRTKASGGTTGEQTVLHAGDLEVAKAQLEEELYSQAKQQVDEELLLFNSEHPQRKLDLLYYEELTHIQYKDFVMPTQFLGTQVQSIPIEGSIEYTAYGYDQQYVLELLSSELRAHVSEDKLLLENSIGIDRLVTHVIDYADDFSWIKLTVDLSGTERYILDPLTPTGARFAKKVRETVKGLHKDDALRIIKNMPEVETASISSWPPWMQTLPSISSNISIEPIIRE